MVISIVACPSSSWTSLRDLPRITRCDAKLCRRVCQPIRRNPARPHDRHRGCLHIPFVNIAPSSSSPRRCRCALSPRTASPRQRHEPGLAVLGCTDNAASHGLTHVDASRDRQRHPTARPATSLACCAGPEACGARGRRRAGISRQGSTSRANRCGVNPPRINAVVGVLVTALLDCTDLRSTQRRPGEWRAYGLAQHGTTSYIGQLD